MPDTGIPSMAGQIPDAVAQFVASLNLPKSPPAGSLQWAELADDDPAKTAALILAGCQWVNEQHWRAMKDASISVSEALEWSKIARFIRDRDEARRSGAYIERVAG